MIVLITVKNNIAKSLITSLLDNQVNFEYNAAHVSFRIKGITQWMLLTDKDCYLLSGGLATTRTTIEIHKDNIEQICIANE